MAAWIGVDDEPVQFEVWAENWPTLEVFLDMCTQWRWTGGMEPRRAGFDMCALPIVCDGREIRRKQRPEVYRGVKAMEAAALEILNS